MEKKTAIKDADFVPPKCVFYDRHVFKEKKQTFTELHVFFSPDTKYKGVAPQIEERNAQSWQPWYPFRGRRGSDGFLGWTVGVEVCDRLHSFIRGG